MLSFVMSSEVMVVLVMACVELVTSEGFILSIILADEMFIKPNKIVHLKYYKREKQMKISLYINFYSYVYYIQNYSLIGCPVTDINISKPLYLDELYNAHSTIQ